MGKTAQLLTTAETARLLRRSVDTLRWWRHRGLGPESFRLGARVFYDRDAVLRWVERERERTTSGELA
jgi:hypothetical protein